MPYRRSSKLLLFIAISIISQPSRADHPAMNLEAGAAGPIATLPAHTLPQGRTSLSLSMQYVDNNQISDAVLKTAAGQHEHVHSTDSIMEAALGGAYGLTDDLTLGFRLPYIDRQDLREGEHHHGGSGDQVAERGDASGHGDLSLFGQYRFFQTPDKRHSAALLLGVRTPTGDTSETDSMGNKFEIDHQPGSGGWGGLFGASWSSTLGRLSVDANLLYTLSTEGRRDTDIGDVVNYNLALAWPLYASEPHHHTHVDHHDEHSHGWLRGLDIVLEMNGDWRERVDSAGERQAHTGGNVVYLSPGVRAGFAAGWSAYASVGLPVIEDLNGQQSEPEYRVIAGISKSF